jgi:hypothetical protein
MSDEISDEEKIEKQVKKPKVDTEPEVSEKKPKQKREYVMTEARKAALDRCRAGRVKKGEETKAKKDQAKELVKQIMTEDKPLKEEPEPVVVKKEKKKKTKQVIIFESDSDSDEEENQIIIRRKRSKTKKEPEPPKVEEPPPVFRLRRL